MKKKEDEKLERYQGLKEEAEEMWEVKATVVPVVPVVPVVTGALVRLEPQTIIMTSTDLKNSIRDL